MIWFGFTFVIFVLIFIVYRLDLIMDKLEIPRWKL